MSKPGYASEKAVPGSEGRANCRFHQLMTRCGAEGILRHAYALANANKYAPDVDGKTFDSIESGGLEKWFESLRTDLRSLQ